MNTSSQHPQETYAVMKERSLTVPAIILAAGLLLSVIIFVYVWSDSKSADQTITVTGSAKRDITSDLGILRGSLAIESPTADGAYRALVSQKPILLDYLATQGFPEDKVIFFTVINNPVYEYNQDGVQTRLRGYVYSQRYEISSVDVEKIRRISLDISSLIEKGVFLQVEPPEYHYTKLATLKVEIQSQAASDAKVRAERIVSATGRDLGPLRNARMGVLQITPRNSNQISDYGMNDVSSIEKEITAVVNASFQIK